MKILSLSEENVKRLSAVELTLDDKGNLIIVAGNNEQGKSSLLDGIEMALHGGGSIPPKPVRRGQEKATIEMSLGEIGLPELTVKRTITSTGGGALVVTNKEGVRMTSPQAVLDALVGKLSFDPLAFAKMKPADRSETLRVLMGLDFSKQDAEKESLYDQRTEVNRVMKAKQAMLGANKRYDDVPAEEQSSTDILAEQQQAMKHNEINAERRRLVQISKIEAEHAGNRAKTAEDQITSTEREIKRLELVLEEQRASFVKLENDAAIRRSEHEKNKNQVADLKDADVSKFMTQLSDLELLNNKVRKNKMVDEISADFKKATKESEALSKQIEAIDRAKRDAIAAAKFPVPGMSLGDAGEVLLDNLPFEQASTKGQLMASLAMGAALNPKLRVLLVRSGNDLDEPSLKLLAEWCDQNSIQCWLERISTSGKVAVIIEDGHAVTQ